MTPPRSISRKAPQCLTPTSTSETGIANCRQTVTIPKGIPTITMVVRKWVSVMSNSSSRMRRCPMIKIRKFTIKLLLLLREMKCQAEMKMRMKKVRVMIKLRLKYKFLHFRRKIKEMN